MLSPSSVLLWCGLLLGMWTGVLAYAAPEMETLPNGLQIAWTLNSSLPVLDLSVVMRTGFRDDPVGKSGLVDLLAASLDRSRGVSQQLEALGASKTVAIDDDFIHVSVHGLFVDESALFSLLFQLMQPDLSEHDFNIEKERRIENWQSALQSPELWASWVHQRFLTSHTPYGRGSVLTLREYARLRLEDLQKFYAKSFIPSQCILVVSGPLEGSDRAKMKAHILTNFGALPVSSSVESRRLKQTYVDSRFLKRSPSRTVRVIDRPGNSQAQLRMGILVPLVSSKERYALEVANALTGGYFNSRLNTTVRDKWGLTYGIQSSLIHAKDLSELIVSSVTRGESVGLLFQKVLEVMDGLKMGAISEEEVAAAKKYLLGRHVLLASNPGAISNGWLAGVLLGMSVTHLEEEAMELPRVTLQQVQAITQKYFQFQNGSVVIVGDGKMIQKSFDVSEQKWNIQQVSSKNFTL